MQIFSGLFGGGAQKKDPEVERMRAEQEASAKAERLAQEEKDREAKLAEMSGLTGHRSLFSGSEIGYPITKSSLGG